MPRDFDAFEAAIIEQNRRKAPTTVKLANLLFDLARAQRSSDVETIAIQVDGWAQSGMEVNHAIVARVSTQVNKALGLETTCQRPIGMNLCSLTPVPGTRFCPAHQTVETITPDTLKKVAGLAAVRKEMEALGFSLADIDEEIQRRKETIR